MIKPPPLTLLDGAFLIDNSSIEKLCCPRYWQYTNLNLRTSSEGKAGANFGSTIHRGLETRYQLVGTEKVDAATTVAIHTSMHQWLDEHPQPSTDFRNFNHACKFIDVYNQIYGKEGFRILNAPKTGKPVIEASFALPFGSVLGVPIIYCGKLDLGIEDHNGIWSFDHKTAFMFGDGFDKQMQVDGGQLGYCWALGQVLGTMPLGYIIDAMRVRRPKVGDEFTGNVPIDRTDFKRLPFYVSPEMLEEWREDTFHLIENIFHYHNTGHFPKHRWNCVRKYGICEFYDVCNTPLAQRDLVLASGMFEDNKWTQGLKTSANV